MAKIHAKRISDISGLSFKVNPFKSHDLQITKVNLTYKLTVQKVTVPRVHFTKTIWASLEARSLDLMDVHLPLRGLNSCSS